MKERSLNNFLGWAIRRGEIDLELNDTIVDSLLEQPGGEASDDSKARVKSKLRARIVESEIARARLSVQQKGLSLGRYIEAVRDCAGLTRYAVADRLGKNEEYLQRIERGDVNPTHLPTKDVVTIVELFCLSLKAVGEMLLVTTRTAETKRTYRAAARSHGGIRHDVRSEDVERALDAFARALHKHQRGAAEIASRPPQEIRQCLSKLEAELRKRGRVDLLG